VHSGTYDQEFIALCNEPIEKPATTTQTPMEIYTTTSTELPPQSPTSTVSVFPTTHVQSTTTERSTTTTSLRRSDTTTAEYIPSTTTSIVQSTTTTLNPTTDPGKEPSSFQNTTNTYIPTKQTQQIIEKTIVQKSNDAAIIISIVISSVSLVGCIAFAIWSYNKHQEHKTHKLVRPSQVEIEVSPTSKQPLVKKPEKPLIKSRDNIREAQIKMDKNAREKAAKREKMMNKRPSQIKNLTLDDWKRLNSELKPQVNRNTKPKTFVPPLRQQGPRPVLSNNRRQPPPVPTSAAMSVKTPVPTFNTSLGVKELAKKFDKNYK
jgi:hypothetical protein